jgi:hypothetical protein
MLAPTQPDPSGATTSVKQPSSGNQSTRNIRNLTKVDYKDLRNGASQFGHEPFRKQHSKAGASVQKSVAKVRKMCLAELFRKTPETHPHLLRPPQNGQMLPDPDPEYISLKILDLPVANLVTSNQATKSNKSIGTIFQKKLKSKA